MTTGPLLFRRFESRDVAAAMDHADAGGVSLHVWRGTWPGRKPKCFHDGQPWGHLIMRDEARLVALAKFFGVRRVRVSRRGRRGQHVDLCGAPLQVAMDMFDLSAALRWPPLIPGEQ